MFWRSVQCCELCGTRLGTADVHVGRTRCARHLTSTNIVVPAPTVELLQSYKLEGSSITSVALSPNGQIVGYTSYNAVQLLQASDGSLLHKMTLYLEKARETYDDEPDPHWADCLAWSPDGRTVACGTRGGDLWLFGADDGKIAWKGEASEGVTSIAYSPNSAMIAFGDWSGRVLVCRVDNGCIIREFDDQAGKISGLSWSPNSQQLASASWDDDVIIRRIDDGDQLLRLQGHSPYPMHVAWSSDGLLIATCDLRSIRIWGYTGQELRVFRQGDHHARQLAWRPDNRTLVSAPADSFSSQYPLQLWHLVADHPVAQLQGHTAFVTGVAWSADGQLLASSGADRTILLWRVR
jgi:WD40 repeat protein